MTAIGYLRTRTTEDPTAQFQALTTAGCTVFFLDIVDHWRAEQPALTSALDHARPGDILTVCKLIRVSRSITQLATLLADLQARGIHFQSLIDDLDTTDPDGNLIFEVIRMLQEIRHQTASEATQEGLQAARDQGRRGGRPALMTKEKIDIARSLHATRRHTLDDIAALLGVSRATIHRYLAPTPDPAEQR
jgi:DNA invertase Pin-like site-specific DNA recombinase